MRRDLGLIRELLLKLEALPLEMYDVIMITPNDPAISVEGYSEHQIADHLSWLQERGLIEVPSSQPAIGIVFTKLTWDGCDFLDSVRDPEIWRKTKQGADAVGSFSFELVKQLAKGFIVKQIENQTGIKL